MTVASEQCVMVGVIRTSTRERELRGERGLMWMSGRLMTDSEPRVRGCSGSDMVEIKSATCQGFSSSVY